MPDIDSYQTIDQFSGVNNIDSPTRLKVGGDRYIGKLHPAQIIENLDIDNTYALQVRPGFSEIVSGTDLHSLWSDGTTCLVVDGTTMYQLHRDWTVTTIRSGLTAKRKMSYAAVNDRVYYTNGHEIGYVHDLTNYALHPPDKDFKLPLPAGQFVECYRGRLYIAKGNVIYIGDPLADYFDSRDGYRTMSSEITMLRAVDDGIYVADNRTYFVNGDMPEKFNRREVYDQGVVPFTDIRVDGRKIGKGVSGQVAVWTSTDGICEGDNGGIVTNQTSGRYSLHEHSHGTAMVREWEGMSHYINSLY